MPEGPAGQTQAVYDTGAGRVGFEAGKMWGAFKLGLGTEVEKGRAELTPRPLSLVDCSRQPGPGPWSSADEERQAAEEVTENRGKQEQDKRR